MLNIAEPVSPPESLPCDSGIPLSQHLHRCTEFSEFDAIPTDSHRFPPIPRNSGITTSMGLIGNDRSWLLIEFRYGIPGIGTSRNRSGIGRNSRNWKQFPPIPTNSGIPGNSYQFLFIIRFWNSVRNWMIEWLVKQVSILLHLLIPELQGIPGNSVFVQLRNKKEFRGTAGN